MFRAVTISVLLSVALCVKGQNESPSYAEQLAALEAEMDSMSMFNLLDSLLRYEPFPASELNIRVGFTSSVTSAGRDYDINQQGLSPGLSYYHKSGLYGDLSGYWNSEIEPHYNPTVLSVGYLGDLNTRWNYSLDYERWFFHPKDSSENSLTNSLGGSISYDFNIGYASVDYSLLFGKETAHRFIGNLTGTINLGKWLFFENIRLYPSATILFGNTDITQLRITRRTFNEALAYQIASITTFENLNENQKRTLRSIVFSASGNGIITEMERNELLSGLRNADELSESQREILQKIVDGQYVTSRLIEENAFGLLNYSFTLPLSLSIKKVNILLSYTYSVPVSLPDEFFEVDPIGYFGASISYRIPLK